MTIAPITAYFISSLVFGSLYFSLRSVLDVLYATVCSCVCDLHVSLYALLPVAMCARSVRDVLCTLLSVAMCVCVICA